MKQTLKNNQLLAPFASSTARAAANLRLTITKIPSWTCCSTSITMVNCLNHKICHRHGIALAKIPTPKHPASDCGWANAKIVATSGRSRSNNCSSAISDSLRIAPCSKKKGHSKLLAAFQSQIHRSPDEAWTPEATIPSPWVWFLNSYHWVEW